MRQLGPHRAEPTIPRKRSRHLHESRERERSKRGKRDRSAIGYMSGESGTGPLLEIPLPALERRALLDRLYAAVDRDLNRLFESVGVRLAG